METGSPRRETVEELAEEFVARYRRGERPPLSEYTDRYPDHAEQIRDLFPALVMMEQIAPSSESEALSGVEGFPHQRPVELPEQIGAYRILREIGRGGMGVVYEAEQISLGRRVALKVLPGHVAGDGKALMRFRREAKAAAGLHHTNIVPVFEVGRDGDVAFYAMQFIQGQGLDQVVDELRRLRDPERKPVTGRHVRSATRPGGRIAPDRAARDRRTGIARGGDERRHRPRRDRAVRAGRDLQGWGIKSGEVVDLLDRQGRVLSKVQATDRRLVAPGTSRRQPCPPDFWNPPSPACCWPEAGRE
jgi:Protein kinase domain